METRALYIRLTRAEFEALKAMSQQDMRPARDQVRWLIAQEAARRGVQGGGHTRLEERDERQAA